MSCTDLTCGVGSGNSPNPGDPDNNIVLSANTIYGGIRVSWSYPVTNSHAVAHTLLYRGVTNNFSQSVQLGVVAGSIYTDVLEVTVPIRYYYWIQLISVNGTVGDVIGPASATARVRAEQTLEGLTGLIDRGVLSSSLKQDIANIVVLGDAIVSEIQNRLAANAALSAALSAIQSANGEALTYINNEIQQRITADSALVSSINTIAAGVAGNSAAIAEERLIRATKDEALSRSTTTLFANVGANTSAIIDERTARATAVEAITTRLNQLLATTGANSAAIQLEQTARTNADSALTSSIATLYATVADSAAAIRDEQIARVTGDSALAASINTVQSSLNGNLASVQTQLQTNINTVDGKVTNIGALYTVKVNVNGLAGGFGIYNDGTTVEAGFDVDRFFVGRTNSNKVKPFIIDNDIVYIDKARIRDADIDTLKIAGNAVTVPAVGGTSCTMYLPYGGSVYVTAHVWLFETSGSDGGLVTAAVSIYLSCSTTGELGGYSIQHTAKARHTTMGTAYKFTVPAGWHTFTTHYVTIDGSYSLSGATTMAIGAMK